MHPDYRKSPGQGSRRKLGWSTLWFAFKAVSHGRANMNVLSAMGTVVSLATGLADFFIPAANYTGIAAMIMAFYLTGSYVETAARGRASQAIKRLFELSAKTVCVIVEGENREIPVERIQIDDVIVVRPEGVIS